MDYIVQLEPRIVNKLPNRSAHNSTSPCVAIEEAQPNIPPTDIDQPDTAAMPSQPSNAGIVTNENSGSREIPESMRSDGTTRKAIKVRPGYRPPEDVETYRNRTADAFRERGKRIGIPGAAGLKENAKPASSAAGDKNAKRREARKKAKADGTVEEEGKVKEEGKEEPADPEVERQKKGRNIKKKLKQARDLQNKKDDGETLLPEQIAKVIKINELIRELDALGIDADEEPKGKADEGKAADKE